ncbi:MAG: OstA family protein [Chitinophagales bacterium]|nr:OstA family protein [Chitinophagales bacterium]
MTRTFTLLFFFLLLTGGLFAQVLPRTTTLTPADTVRLVEVLESKKLEFLRIDSMTELQIMVGNVKLRQGNSTFWCDSCVKNEKTGIFEAFGRVHLNDNDTTDVYSDYLLYNINTRLANLRKNVKLTDGKGVLTTQELDYDVNTKIGTYKNGGRVVNDKTVVTSKEGVYYSDLRDVYFKKNVELKNPEFYVKTDSILYNTGNETARFIAQTFIRDSSGRTIDTREGYYNLKTGNAEFGRRSVINDGDLQVTGDMIYNNDSLGIVQIEGNGIVRDTAQGRTVIANKIFVDKNKDAFLATQKPVMIIKEDQDSIFITADTLFSARLTDLYGKAKKDTVAKDSLSATPSDSTSTTLTPADSLTAPLRDTIVKLEPLQRDSLQVNDDKDSTNRYFEAFRNVRIFSDSLQAVCDSMFYSFKDSTFRLYDNPVVWTNKNQVLGDTILLFTRNRKAHKMEVFNNAFLAAQLDPEIFNQIRSRRVDAWFTDGSIDSARARGGAESIYFVQDQDSAYTGVNQSECELYDVYFIEQELKRIVARNNVKGVLWPMRQKSPTEMRLIGFQWLEEKRPKTWFELFE